MATFLNLVQRLGREVGASGTLLTVTNATGEYARLVDWIGQAWIEIQEAHPDYLWQRKSIDFETVVGQGRYFPPEFTVPVTDFENWRNGSFRVYLDTVGNENLMSQLPYDTYRDTYLYGTTRTTQGYPTVVTVAPDKSALIALIPDRVYHIVADYYTLPQELLIDTDVPTMPSRFHMAIVYKAMQWYGSYENAPEVVMRGIDGYTRLMSNIVYDQTQSVMVRR
jgi:hypothetical protein